ncbi:E-selectin-like, partial [Ruditapes philippinarum]|uniref:E-selectin-like n=1 Tax=Ruditapes philippinarum TaxID=129788 RepID=UPI00295AC7E9
IKYRYGPSRGRLLEGSKWGRTYTVSYRSRADTEGLTATCMITLKVKVIFCPTPKAPKYGTVNCSGTHYGHTCNFFCPIGHTPTVTSMTCQLNGYWTHGGSSECQVNTCPQTFPTIEHGYYSCSKFTIGTSCNPTCDPGYSVFRLFPIVCKLDGQWSLPVDTICKDSEPPIILNCPSNITMTAEKGKTSAIVTWHVPSAFDKQDNSSVTVNQTAGSITPGSRIEGGVVHILKYNAFDSALNPSEECLFYVQVKIMSIHEHMSFILVTKCSRISAPSNGHYKCDKGFIYGSQCNYTCYEGYLLQGASSSTCDQNGDWNSSTPICKEVECLPPEEYGISTSNGYFICPSPIKYQSVCYAICDSGFKLAQYTSAICKVDSNNTPFLSLSLQPVCLDIDPPTFDNCQGTKVLTFPAAKGKTTAVIQYDFPTASDNVDPSPEVIKIQGPDSGDTVDANDIEFVEFKAMDDVENVSPLCLYVLQVDGKLLRRILAQF